MLSKIKRIEDRELLDEIKKRPCLCCLSQPPSDAHHVKSQGSSGDDVWFNLIPLCRKHHQLFHAVGVLTFLEMFPNVKEYLFSIGWEMNFGKLFHPSLRY